MNNLQQIAESYQQYKTAYESGQISSEEFKILLQGLEVEKAISVNAEELQYKEQLNTIINAAIAAASALA